MKDDFRKIGTAVLWPRNVADRYGISPTTLWRWEKQGHLPARDFAVGDRTGWTIKSIEKFEADAQI